MYKILVAGAGKIGSLITYLFLRSKRYEIWLIDKDFKGIDCSRLPDDSLLHRVILNVQDEIELDFFLRQNDFNAIISSLPYFCNIQVAEMARKFSLHYFDLTEDVKVSSAIKSIAKGAKSAFVPQCGLAPGFIGLVTNNLIESFSQVDSVKMRVGALPINVSNALQYSLTWSTEGIINEYGNVCYGIENKKIVALRPLEGLEEIQIDGVLYEAFNTSGGLGGLGELYVEKVENLDYKTIRYPGHCEKMNFLMNGLLLNNNRDILKLILERAIPKTYQDVVVIYVSVTGIENGEFVEKNYVNKLYPQKIGKYTWSSIQITTASAICAVVDIILNNTGDYQGYIYQEQFELKTFLKNQYGQYYAINSAQNLEQEEYLIKNMCNITSVLDKEFA